MSALNKNEKQIAETMNQYHWRAWLPLEDLADELGKKAGFLRNTLLDMAKREVVEQKGEEQFRLTPQGRQLIAE